MEVCQMIFCSEVTMLFYSLISLLSMQGTHTHFFSSPLKFLLSPVPPLTEASTQGRGQNKPTVALQNIFASILFSRSFLTYMHLL